LGKKSALMRKTITKLISILILLSFLPQACLAEPVSKPALDTGALAVRAAGNTHVRVITSAEKQEIVEVLKNWLLETGVMQTLDSAGIEGTFLLIASLGRHGKGLTFMADADIAFIYRRKNDNSCREEELKKIISGQIGGYWHLGSRPHGAETLGSPFLTYCQLTNRVFFNLLRDLRLREKGEIFLKELPSGIRPDGFFSVINVFEHCFFLEEQGIEIVSSGPDTVRNFLSAMKELIDSDQSGELAGRYSAYRSEFIEYLDRAYQRHQRKALAMMPIFRRERPDVFDRAP